MKLAIIDYGAGNLFSVSASFEKLGVIPLITDQVNEILSADLVVFPGVGHAQAAMNQLRSKRLDQLIIGLTQPVLGICLGMQLMCEFTEEGNTQGLAIFDGVQVRRLNDEVKSPHMGWNELNNTKQFLAGIEEDMYFVHSYYALLNPYTIAEVSYGEQLSAALQKNNFMACQFHPEKSALGGQKILERFINLK